MARRPTDALVLDTGALIALERGDAAVWTRLKRAAQRNRAVLIPAAALAQAWRATPSQAMLSRALEHCAIASFDIAVKQIGALCGKAATSDVCDAHVAIVTASRGDELWTSDPEDLRRLLRALDVRREIAVVRC
jgi:hypothetical protein